MQQYYCLNSPQDDDKFTEEVSWKSCLYAFTRNQDKPSHTGEMSDARLKNTGQRN